LRYDINRESRINKVTVGNGRKYKVFISSTMRDLQDLRDAADRAIRELGHDPIRAETYPTQPTSSREVILQMIQESDIILGIYVSRYGFIPLGEKISVIEMEFEAAKQSGKEILIYIAKAENREPELEEFLRRIQDFDTGLFRRPYFETIDQLTAWIKGDVLDLIHGPKFHVFMFKEYARRLGEWALKYRESSWGGRYTDLNVKLLDVLLYARRRGADYARSASISETIEQSQIALITGEAGSGKTTALLHAVKAEADRVIKNEARKVPIFVALNAWTEQQDLESLILASLASLGRQLDKHAFHTYLSEGRFLLAFDGINEIPSAKRSKSAERDLATFIKANPGNHIVVTTRPVGYDPKPFEDWPIYEIQPLDRESILDFAAKYLGDDLGRRLFHKLGGEDPTQWQKLHSLISLARNPLLLWMFTETYWQLGDIPQDKGALIKIFVEFLFQIREQGKASRYSSVVKNHLLRSLAFEMLESGEIVRSSLEKVIEVFSSASSSLRAEGLLDAQTTVLDLLEEIRANGLLHLENGSSIRWSHQLFQEFFGALELVHRFETSRPIWKQLNSAEWKESAIMAAGLTRKPERYIISEVMNGWRGFLGLFVFENPRALLAINCVNETYLWDNEQLRNKVNATARLRIANGINQNLSRFGGLIVSRIGKPFSGLFLRLAMLPFKSYYVLGFLLWALGETRERRAVPILTSKLKSDGRVIRWVAVDALRKIKDPSAIDSLIESLSDYDGDVRWAVLQSLIYIGDPRVSPSIAPLLNHPDPTTRWAAAFALSKIGNEANLPELEEVRNNDRALVWWGETVSQAAELAISEIKRRTSLKGQAHPEGMKDMVEHVYYGTKNT
jgi:hypothetical protein